MTHPQAFVTAYPPRLRNFDNPLLTPIVPTQSSSLPLSRTTKRGTAIINYAEDGFDLDLDDEDDFGARSRRSAVNRNARLADLTQPKEEAALEKATREISRPVKVQGIWREWMGRLLTAKPYQSDMQHSAQSLLPFNLIPIRIDVEIQAHRPEPALPLPPGDLGMHPRNVRNPIYFPGELTPAYRLRDTFLWNLWETIITPEHFARTLVQDLDLPNPRKNILEIASQIRTQLEEYAPLVLHPLFNQAATKSILKNVASKPSEPPAPLALRLPKPSSRPSLSRFHSSGSGKPHVNGVHLDRGPSTPRVNASATLKYPPPPLKPTKSAKVPSKEFDVLNPDDAYRCVLNIAFPLGQEMYTDRLEWSLTHPAGFPENFAKKTAADLNLGGEWVSAISHAIYEAVYRCRKEAIETGILPGAQNEVWASTVECALGPAPRDAGAGWRFDGMQIGSRGGGGFSEDWGPKIERLTTEEIEKREGDRERRVRRLKREQARFSTFGGDMTAGLSTPGFPGTAVNFSFGLDTPNGPGSETPVTAGLGRGERRKRRRFRSPSSTGRSTPDPTTGQGIAGLSEHERRNWRCHWCLAPGLQTWALKSGPKGPRSLCANCGYVWERDRRLTPQSHGLHLKYDFIGLGSAERPIGQSAIQGSSQSQRAQPAGR